MGGRGTSSGISGGSRTFHHLHEANTFFAVGESKGMFPDWQKDITAEERDAAVYYTTNAYTEINKWLRGVNGLDPANAPQKIKDTAARVTTAADKFNLTENITVWRGGSNKLVGGASTIEEVKKLIGRTVHDKGIMSTAVTAGAMWDKSGGNIGYEIEVPKGKGRGFFVDPISAHHGEQEFTIPPKTRFKITGAYTDTHGNVICKLRVLSKRAK